MATHLDRALSAGAELKLGHLRHPPRPAPAAGDEPAGLLPIVTPAMRTRGQGGGQR
jgi:hypothetical protein